LKIKKNYVIWQKKIINKIMKNFLIKFFRAFIHSLKQVNPRYGQIFLKTLVSQNQPEDKKKRYLFGVYLPKYPNYYCLLLLSKIKIDQEKNQYRPFLYMKTGLHELSKISIIFIYDFLMKKKKRMGRLFIYLKLSRFKKKRGISWYFMKKSFFIH
jgi:hypothetical protein